jgi:hypothetical protein
MRFIDIEDNLNKTLWPATLIGLTLGALATWWFGGRSGTIVIAIAPAFLILAIQFGRIIRLPAEARRAAEHVGRWFEARFPDHQLKSLAVRAVEPERYVISVRCERNGVKSWPTPRRYFAVARSDFGEIIEVPHGQYWGRGLK